MQPVTRERSIRYLPSETAWDGWSDFLQKTIVDNGSKVICDVGGGANPQLPLEFVEANGIDYTVLDISQSELDKAPAQYHKICADVAAKDFAFGEAKFDLIFSKMVAEHVKSARNFHTNIRNMLKPGGLSVHFFPTLYTLPFTVNRLIPESLSSAILNVVAPRNRYQFDKFPAYYDWCRGPTKRQINRLEGLGYEVVDYVGFYGHAAYYRRIPPLRVLHNMKSAFLLRNPMPTFTSFAYLILRKV